MNPAAFRRQVGLNVQSARWAAGLTQVEVAAVTGVDSRHYQKIEGGRVDAKLSTLLTIAVGLGATVAALVEMDPVATKHVREKMRNASAPPTGRKPRRPTRKSETS